MHIGHPISGQSIMLLTGLLLSLVRKKTIFLTLFASSDFLPLKIVQCKVFSYCLLINQFNVNVQKHC